MNLKIYYLKIGVLIVMYCTKLGNIFKYSIWYLVKRLTEKDNQRQRPRLKTLKAKS